MSRAGGISGDAGNGESQAARISGDGRWITFASTATNLDPADGDATRDVFVRDMQGAATTLVSRAAGVAGVPGNDASDTPDISADGRYVTFASTSSNLHPADVDAVDDVYLRDLADGATILVSRASGAAGPKGSSTSGTPRISADGATVAFWSEAGNLEPDGAGGGVFMRYVPGSATFLISRAPGFLGPPGAAPSFTPAISDDGQKIAFVSLATNFDPPDDAFLQDVYVRNFEPGNTTRVSRATGTAGFKNHSGRPTLSDDGRYVAFESASSRLVAVDDDTTADVFVRDTQSGSTTLVSRASGVSAAKSTDTSYGPAISGDGRHVVFLSWSTGLDPADGNTVLDVFVRDLEEARTTLVSRAPGTDGAAADNHSFGADISADGRYVAFQSLATNLVDGVPAGVEQVYVRDLRDATTTLVSRATGAQGAIGDDSSSFASISADGRFVAFDSLAANLDPADADPEPDVYVRDLHSSTTTLVSRASGPAGDHGEGWSFLGEIAGDGNHVAFKSYAANLHPDDGDPNADVFVRDLRHDTTTLVSTTLRADGDSDSASISADGRYVAFESTARTLHPDDGDDLPDIVVRDLHTGATALASRASGPSGAKGNNSSLEPALSADGRYVGFTSFASSIDPADEDGIADVYVRDLLGSPPTEPLVPPPAPQPAAPAAKPVNVAKPSIGGRAVIGRRLSCSRGRWASDTPMRFNVQWVRAGRMVARGSRRRVAAGDVRRRLSCRVTATNAAGRATATSAAVRPRDALVRIRVTGAVLLPGASRLPRDLACRGSLALTLSKGKRVVGRRSVTLDGSRCRWTWRFQTMRSRLDGARKLTLTIRFSGNDYLNPTAQTRRVKVPPP